MENRGMQNLPGKTAFVTGGASGIGLGIAKALLGAGMNVVIADIRADHLAAATAELGAAERVLALKLDVTDRAAYARRSEEHTSELQSQSNLVCRLLLEKKNNTNRHSPRLRSSTLAIS